MSRGAETGVDGVKQELVIQGSGSEWPRLLLGQERARLEAILPAYLRPRRWFGGKVRQIRSVQIRDAARLGEGAETSFIVLAAVTYADGPAEIYVLPMTYADGERAKEVLRETPHALVAYIENRDGAGGLLYDAVMAPYFCVALLRAIASQQRLVGVQGDLVASTTRAFESLRGGGSLEPKIMRAEQSNSSIAFGDQLILKLFRRLEMGINPDIEIGRFLTEQQEFPHIPPVAGSIEYQGRGGEPMSLALLQGFVSNQGDAWAYTLGALEGYYARVRTSGQSAPEDVPLSTGALLSLAAQEAPSVAREMLGSYLESARLLGQRTAEMHLALAGASEDPDFAPEPFTESGQRDLYHSITAMTARIFRSARRVMEDLGAEIQDDVRTLVEREEEIAARVRAALDRPLGVLRIRCHGDYHLGQVLYTGKDFFIIDFEGEPARPLSERRLKRSPLQDVAGMLRSFHYAAYAALFAQGDGLSSPSGEQPALEPWARSWHRWVSTTFLKAYLEAARQSEARFLPGGDEELRALLDVYLLEKAVYELGYELNNRPDWIKIPLQGILQLLDTRD